MLGNGAIYYVAVVELDGDWVENQKDHAGLRAVLDERRIALEVAFAFTLTKS